MWRIDIGKTQVHFCYKCVNTKARVIACVGPLKPIVPGSFRFKLLVMFHQAPSMTGRKARF